MAKKAVKRQILPREIVPVVIGAGITEQWYFQHLQRLTGYRIKIRPRYFGDEHVAALEKNVENVLATEGRAIVVFDADVAA